MGDTVVVTDDGTGDGDGDGATDDHVIDHEGRIAALEERVNTHGERLDTNDAIIGELAVRLDGLGDTVQMAVTAAFDAQATANNALDTAADAEVVADAAIVEAVTDDEGDGDETPPPPPDEAPKSKRHKWWQ
jgi:hypothetical protein